MAVPWLFLGEVAYKLESGRLARQGGQVQDVSEIKMKGQHIQNTVTPRRCQTGCFYRSEGAELCQSVMSACTRVGT